MTIYAGIALLLIIFAVIGDLKSLSKRVTRLEFDLARKVDKPPEETPTELFVRERKERIARLEKEEADQNKTTHS